MASVSVVKYGGDLTYLVGTVKSEAVASINPQITVKKKDIRLACIRLKREEKGISAWEGYNELGQVAWDDHTNAIKLPAFIRKLLEIP
jgi:hypothetical protein